MGTLRLLRIRLGCPCRTLTCALDALLGCRVRPICDAHDRTIQED